MNKYSASQIYLFMVFMMSLASSTIFTTYSIYYVTELGLSPFQLVLVGTVLEITVLVFEGITGVVADTYSRKLSVIIGMLVLGCAFILEGSIIWIMKLPELLPAFGWLLMSQILFGLGWTFVSGADTAWIVDELEGEETGKLFMRSKRFALSASLLGIAASTGLSVISPNLPFLTGGVVYLLLGLLLIRYMQETGFTRREREPHSSPLREMGRTWVSGASVLRQHPLLLLLTVVTLFNGAASEGYDRLWQIHLIEGVGFPDTALSMAAWFGLISAAGVLLGLAAVYFAEKTNELQHERKVSALLFILATVRMCCIVLLALAPDFWAAVAVVLALGVIQSISDPVYTTWLNAKLPGKNRATLLSMISQSDALGQSAGGPVVGYIGSRVSVRASLLTAGVLLLPVIALYGKVTRKR
ncbi:MFS transporter [Paenibacillus sp. MMS20-IR301]|uniref:MFS transporter n=1 Tax=Paenibacillus sp. MMS20-IR301 TaxID=2895946 RepID=UPI0028F0CF1A|nr:MFS transporter [Paenibacillus sp. MMS20-IR301]WNS46609.1 MFS transporter [Paenibacillus sp. MMS20-IR301]